jgi:hypothetical protein
MWRRLAAVLAVAVLAGACTADPSAGPSTADTRSPATAVPNPTPAATPFAGDLVGLLIPAPASSVTVAPPASVDLDTLAVSFAHGLPDAAESLRRLGFRRAATATWRVDGQNVVTVTLAQFADAAGARQWMTESSQYVNPPWDEETYANSVLPGAFGGDGGRWVVTDFDSVDGTGMAVAYFLRGEILGTITVGATGPEFLATARKIGDDQYARLP